MIGKANASGLLGRIGVVFMCALASLVYAYGEDAKPTASAPAGEFKEFIITEGKFQPDWDSLSRYECPEWFRDAKFGIWAHWTAQCVPEQGDWYARNMYVNAQVDKKTGKVGGPSSHYKYHLANYGHPSKFGFKDIDNLWKVDKWEPEKLMELYKRAGAKYFVALANHHDNLDCYDSKYQPWNTVNIGPKKDIVGLWAAAARKNGLRFGVTVHAGRAWSWFEVAQGSDPDGPYKGVPYDGKLTKADGKGMWWEGYDPQDLYAQNHKPGEKPDKAYCEKFFNRTKDLIDKYKPDLVYFDDSVLPLNNVSSAGLYLAAHLYNANMLQHDGKNEAVMNTKGLNAAQRHCLVWDIERGQSDRIEPFPWQTDTCIGAWHYLRSLYENHRYKTATTVITTLADIVSKNGNLLLNVPVRGDGTIDEDEVKVLEDIAKWMETNSECIFGTRPWKIFGEGKANVSGGGNFNEGKIKFGPDDIRFTMGRSADASKGDVIYAIVLGWPEKELVIRSMGKGSPLVEGEASDIHLLGFDGKLKFSRDADGLKIKMPEKKPGDHAFAFKITGFKTNFAADTGNLPYVPKAAPEEPRKAAAAPAAEQAGKLVEQAADGSMKLEPETAETHGRVKAETKGSQSCLGYWDSPRDWVAWKVKISKGGTFEVSALVAAAKGDAEFVVEIGAQQFTAKAANTGDWAKFEAAPVGKVEIKDAGEVVVKVRAKNAETWGKNHINLGNITFKPAP